MTLFMFREKIETTGHLERVISINTVCFVLLNDPLLTAMFI